MGRPRRGASRDTRKRILDAAVDLLSERGAKGTSMRALAAAVGLRESALYHHFSSKDELLRAALSTPEAPPGEGDTSPPGPPELPQDALDQPLEEIFLALAHQMADAYGTPRRRKQLRALLAAGGSPDEDTWRQISDEPRRRLSRALKRLRRDGRVREDLDLDVVHLHVVAPLLFATGILAPGKKLPITIPLARFLEQHAALLSQALAAGRVGRKH